MPYKCASSAAWLLFGLRVSAIASPQLSPLKRGEVSEVCVPGGAQPQVVVYPVAVQTYCPSNTVISIPGCPQVITVTNAPTTLTTAVTATTTITATVTSTETAVPTAGLCPAARLAVGQLNTLTSRAYELTGEAREITAGAAGQAVAGRVSDGIDALSNLLANDLAALQNAEPLPDDCAQQPVVEALSNFSKALAGLLDVIDQKAGFGGNVGAAASSAVPGTGNLRKRANVLNASSIEKLASSLRGLKNATDAYIAGLISLFDAVTADLRLLRDFIDALFRFIGQALGSASTGPSTGPTTSMRPTSNSTGTTSLPVTIPPTTVSSSLTTSIPVSLPNGTTSVPVTIGPTTISTSLTTSLPISIPTDTSIIGSITSIISTLTTNLPITLTDPLGNIITTAVPIIQTLTDVTPGEVTSLVATVTNGAGSIVPTTLPVTLL